jgi:hypothetical protein
MQLAWSAPNRKFGTLDALGLVGVIGLLVGRFIPVARLIPFWGCAFRTFTGFPCPGCGLTRVADRFAHLNFFGALKANPAGTLAAALFALAAIWSALHLLFKVPTPELTLTERDWVRAKWLAIVFLILNYGFVIVQHRHPFL